MDRHTTGRVKPRSLKLGFFNANGLSSQRDEIGTFIREHHLDILLVQETFLKPAHRNPKIANFDIVRNDRLNSPMGGTLIYFRRSLHCIPMDPPALKHIEASICRLAMSGHQPITLVSAYLSPCSTGDNTRRLLRSDLQALLDLGGAVIIAGDLNAKNTRWNCLTTNPRGTKLESLSGPLSYDIITPLEPTHYPANVTHRPDILDVALLKNINLRLCSVEVLHELVSDHRPVIIDFAPRLGPPDTGHIPTRMITDWARLERELESASSVIKQHLPDTFTGRVDTEAAIDRLTDRVQSLINDCSREVPATDDRRWNLPDDVRDLLRRKNAATRAYDRYPCEANRVRLRSLQRDVKSRIKELRESRWDTTLSELEPTHLAFWQLSRSLSKDDQKSSLPPLNRPNRPPAFDDDEKTECLAESLELQCTLSDQHTDLGHISEIDSEVERRASLPLPPQPDRPTDEVDNDHTVSLVTPDEVRTVIKGLHPRKAPGSDGISNRVIKLFPYSLVVLLTSIFNAAITHNIFPQQWKQAVVIGIPKPGKPKSEPTSYRPISLLKGLGKVYERLLYVRLKAYAETSLLIPHEQFGFRTKHSCVHQVHRIVEYISAKLTHNMFTGVLFFDVAKAFDKVWHNGLLYKLFTMGVPPKLVLIIRDYLSDRSFRYRVEGALSQPHAIRAGVPQGSVLSPLLYSLYVADIPKHRHAQTALFADDTAIYYAGRDPTSVSRTLQSAANALGAWFRKWRIEVNPEKSQAVLFHRRSSNLYPPGATPQIRMFGSAIPWAREAKYLGVTLDNRLSFRPHIRKVRNRAAFVLGRLHSLVNSRSKLSLRHKVRLYTACVRPIMTYASVVFAHVRPNKIHRLQTLQNRFMRKATGAPWYMRNEDLHIDLELPTIRQFMKQCSRSYFDSAQTHPNPLVVEAIDYTPSRISKVRRPRLILDELDDRTTLAQDRAYTAREAIQDKPRFRPRRRGRNTRRAKVKPVDHLRSTLPTTPQAEARGSPPLGTNVV